MSRKITGTVPPMEPKQLRAVLAAAGLSQRGAARMLDIDERTMRRYAAGEWPIPRTVQFSVNYLLWLKEFGPK